jgi:hypothetical protein
VLALSVPVIANQRAALDRAAALEVQRAVVAVGAVDLEVGVKGSTVEGRVQGAGGVDVLGAAASVSVVVQTSAKSVWNVPPRRPGRSKSCA